jgi:hypothetical protein
MLIIFIPLPEFQELRPLTLWGLWGLWGLWLRSSRQGKDVLALLSQDRSELCAILI